MLVRYFSLLAVISVALASVPATAQNYTLVWADEFDYTGLPDATKWTYNVGGGGWGNQELQFYTEADLDNASVADGALTITARLESLGGRRYTSARLLSRGLGEWTYGRFEARAKLPAGRGTWPAIWMLYAQGTYGGGGWPDNGEIDIMEHVGWDPSVVHATIHNEAYNGLIGTQRGASTVVEDFDTAFHVYAVEWTPSQIRGYVDDLLYFTYDNPGRDWTEWPFDHPMFMILNIAVGGTWGGIDGVDDSIFPVTMEVDYVRVYQDLQAAPSVVLTSPEAGDGFDVGAAVSFAGTASDVAPGIETVELMQDDGVVARLTGGTASFTNQVADAQPGCYQVRARAIDGDGYQSTTDLIPITVGDATDCPQAPYLIAAHPIGRTDADEIEAEYFDLGGPGVAYFEFGNGNMGNGGIRQGEDVDIEPTQDFAGGYNVTGITRREWLEYTVDVERAGRYTVDVRVAAGPSGGEFDLAMDGTPVAEGITFNNTGGLQRWNFIRIPDIVLSEGLQTLRFTANTTGFNLGKFTFRFAAPVASEDDAAPASFGLTEVYPNPVRDRASLTYQLDQPGPATLAVYDVTGRRVATLADGMQPAGTFAVPFDVAGLSSGVYVVVLETAQALETRRLVVAR
ncbi:MAG: family 16 glycosylhydrolase [Bacteroidota bacterium]